MKPYAILLFPFYFSAAIFSLVYQFSGIDFARKFAENTSSVFQITSIYRAFVLTQNDAFLYYWLYAILFIPLFLVTMGCSAYLFFGAKKRDSRRFDFSSRIVIIGSAFVIVVLFLCLGTSDTYTGVHFLQVFPPSWLGILSYAFAFQGIAFFGSVPFLRLCFALKIIR